MALFGLATEGITDQIVLENILCGFYKDYEDLDEEIQALEPPRDETDMRQAYSEFGTGWSALFNYFSQTRFRDDVLNSQYVIIQIDTDIAEDMNCSKTQSVKDILECVTQKLINQIDSNDKFYQAHKVKIIFAISVHSLEYWILPLHLSKKETIHQCFDKLKKEVSKSSKKLKVEKTYRSYDTLSRAFLKNKKLMQIVPQNSSFQIFIDSLPTTVNHSTQ